MTITTYTSVPTNHYTYALTPWYYDSQHEYHTSQVLCKINHISYFPTRRNYTSRLYSESRNVLETSSPLFPHRFRVVFWPYSSVM